MGSSPFASLATSAGLMPCARLASVSAAGGRAGAPPATGSSTFCSSEEPWERRGTMPAARAAASACPAMSSAVIILCAPLVRPPRLPGPPPRPRPRPRAPATAATPPESMEASSSAGGASGSCVSSSTMLAITELELGGPAACAVRSSSAASATAINSAPGLASTSGGSSATATADSCGASTSMDAIFLCVRPLRA